MQLGILVEGHIYNGLVKGGKDEKVYCYFFPMFNTTNSCLWGNNKYC